ncbi:MAG: DUF2461 domain-containing protein [Gammaproteobacteria bacterium]|nr:DUF2461 domain-containing protein [Gammaproteobacteria bacterium]MDH5729040.1 DUF2461 domain-containing protein [Gammaproteobacteria bacterium]
MGQQYFSEHSYKFLAKLEKNNNRDWFNQHKHEYEQHVREPALRFIEDFADELFTLSPFFRAIPKKVGGSLMRVHRDVRFGKDKRPYKSNIGIQFRHERGKDVHAPGFYVHIEPGECFVGVGIWRPDAEALAKIREAIIEKPDLWRQASQQTTFKKHFQMSGESLKNAPRGYDKDHPLLDDLKRKDFIAIAKIDEDIVISNKLTKTVFNHFSKAESYMAFLCAALELQY